MFGKNRHRLDQKVEQLWSLDGKVGAILRGDCYRARAVGDNSPVFISLTRKPLDDQEFKGLVDHVKGLGAALGSGASSFGVDSEGIGFVVLDGGGRKRLDFDHGRPRERSDAPGERSYPRERPASCGFQKFLGWPFSWNP